MNWTALTALLKTDWVRKRATTDLLLLAIVMFAGHFVLNVMPKQQEQNRQAWQNSREVSEKTLVNSLDAQEKQHGQQIQRVCESADKAAETFKESHKEAMDLFRDLSRKMANAIDDKSDAHFASGNARD